MLQDNIPTGLTFDDVLLLPAQSEILPSETDISTLLTRNIKINIPIVSAAMDTVTERGKLIGILTNRDLRFETNFSKRVSQVMTRKNLITAPVGRTLDEAQKILHKYKIEKLPIVDKDNNLKGLITIKDIEKRKKYPNACKDSVGRLCVGGAIGTVENAVHRAELLAKAGADVIVIDTAHGHTSSVITTIKTLKKRLHIDVIAGNIATEEGAEDPNKGGAG